MENSKHCKQGAGQTTEDLLRLLYQLMSPEDGNHISFDRVNVDGSNVGSVMNVRRSGVNKEPPECSINIYVSNNIQGVNNSILVGSEVKMGEPGLGISFGDVMWERGTRVRSKAKVKRDMSKFVPRFWFNAVLVCALVLSVSVLFGQFGPGRK